MCIAVQGSLHTRMEAPAGWVLAMTLRTPRRRISPRTKRRYRAIREFFRRALGSASQQDIKINSSIAVNVTDLKHKILGIENQLTEVSKHCRDLVCLDTSFRKGSENLRTNTKKNIHTIDEQTEVTDNKSKSSDTKVLFKNNCRRSEESDYATLDYSASNTRKNITPPNNMYYECHSANETKVKKKRHKPKDLVDTSYDCDPNLRKHKAQSAFDNVTSVYSTSYQSVSPEYDSPHIDAECTKQRHDKKHVKRREYIEHTPMEEPRYIKHKEQRRKSDSPPRNIDEKHRSKKNKRVKSRIDQEFIADIIKRQYKPLKLFGRRDSEISQFSAPVCRDQEYSLHEDIQEGEELCSCCFDAHNRSMFVNSHVRNHELSDMRSICDTRLYSSKRNSRIRRHRQHADIYNDAALYDLIPVKEKSSPKSRRKFAENHMIDYNYYKEVPPSPRTQRPRLNLKAQYYTEYDDYMVQVKPNRGYPKMRPQRQEYLENLESDITSEIILPRNRRERHKSQKLSKVPDPIPIQQETGTMSSLPSPRVGNEQNNDTFNEIALNKTQETDISVKTDKALCEIKDILQSFLQEIKKDATACDNNTELNNKTTQKRSSGLEQNATNNAAPMLDNGQNNFNNQAIPQCSIAPQFMPPFQNPCCYPILPICPMNPMNCMQSGYIMPSPSFTCHACTTTKETVCHDCSKHNKASHESCKPTNKNDTDELIKEIYKFVAQSPNSGLKKSREDGPRSHRKEVNSPETKELTSRSVGACSNLSKHDAQVGTPMMKSYSKSCEAIGSRMMADTSYTTTTQSDTVLEKLSLEVTQSTSDSESSSDYAVFQKKKKGKFTKVLQSIGLFKKKKKDIIEEITETESSVAVEVKPLPPFRQEITNYTMHGQEYFNKPPVPPYQRPEGPFGCSPPPGYDPRAYYANQMSPPNDAYTHHIVHRETIPEQEPSRYHPEHRHPDRHGYPSAPPYPNYEPHCSHHQPQVPLCLKEIEVKSTGTQSERKTSFFQKLAMKPPAPGTARSDPIKNISTQTPQTNNPAKPEKPGLFSGWKNLQAKGDANTNAGKFSFRNPKIDEVNTNPMKFSFKTQKQLAEGDMKMRNVMLKKMFYKRNPFSPRNLIVRTIMGKDQSSYGEPKLSLRPRMFF